MICNFDITTRLKIKYFSTKSDVVMQGYDGSTHFSIAEGRVRLVPMLIYQAK
jgi:L-arabinose isomerase